MTAPQVTAPRRPGGAGLREILRNPRYTPWAAGLGALAGILAVSAWFLWALPLGRALDPLASPTLILVSSDGETFARRGAMREDPVDITELPPHVGAAFVAIEDRRFYQHNGVDLRAIARALRANMQHGRVREGGSTITQQLAKNAFLSSERTLRRKAQEALIALYLEARLSKAEILSRYVSSVYFGDGVFGLRAAARHYFNKTPEQLTIGEAAMLAGVVRAPTRLAPTDHPRDSRTRQRQVLAAMVETGAITPAQARAARRVRLRVQPVTAPLGSYFADWLMPAARQRFDRARGEVQVATTLDSRVQAHAEQVVRRTLAGPGRAMGVSQAAMVVMRTDGRVLALVGGRDYRASAFNRATDAQRQPGSSFKLFVYLAALRAGASADTLVADTPLQIANWSPGNYDGRYAGGPVTLRDAFARSSNVAAVRLSEQVGREHVIQTARDLGLTHELPNNPTVALGSGQVTLVEMTAAYASVASGVYPVRPHGLVGRPAGERQRLDPRVRAQMLDMMHAVVANGTGRAANLPMGSYGKTGTSQDYRDAWFFGFVGDLVIGVWVGNDDNSPMRRVTGGTLPAQMWRDVMTHAIRTVGVRQDPPLPAPVPTGPSRQALLPDEPIIEVEDPALMELPPSDNPFEPVRPDTPPLVSGPPNAEDYGDDIGAEEDEPPFDDGFEEEPFEPGPPPDEPPIIAPE